MANSEQSRIIDLIAAQGPCTGLELKKESELDSLALWRACKTSPELQVRCLGRRYLRLDRRVDGFARLSPSILREFLTYSVVGLIREPVPLEKRCRQVIGRIHEITRYKYDLARQLVAEVMAELRDEVPDSLPACFILAGDIVHDMAHDVPRPEHSSGKLVKGSDIDLVVVVDDLYSESDLARLDGIIYRKKYRLLIDPAVNEELDYKVKRLAVVRKQADFADFPHMVAIKILHEGLLLAGSEDLFDTVKAIIKNQGLLEKLDGLEELARSLRKQAETDILEGRLGPAEIKKMGFFYSAEEFEEFE
ncbi:MAG: hypothetical protein JXB25_12790 [Deltaproteobacteria bacterium]|nr:hypothetical protein [Deltaproteobacteria bacterium]